MSTDALLTTHADYLADTSHVSNTMLATFRESPELYHGRYVAKTLAPKEDTEATVRGTLLHLSQSEPDTWQDRFVISPEFAPDGKKWYRRKGSDHEKWWNEFLAECNEKGKWHIAAEERERLIAMAAELVADPIAAGLLASPSVRERTISWTDTETCLPCKCRPDVALTNTHCLIDLKTCMDPTPEGFNRNVERLGYAHQAEFYRAGYMRTHGDVDTDFVFIAIGSEPPHRVFVHRLNIEWQMIGHEENGQDLRRLADCYAFDQWRDPRRSSIQSLSPPTWRVRKYEEAA